MNDGPSAVFAHPTVTCSQEQMSNHNTGGMHLGSLICSYLQNQGEKYITHTSMLVSLAVFIRYQWNGRMQQGLHPGTNPNAFHQPLPAHNDFSFPCGQARGGESIKDDPQAETSLHSAILLITNQQSKRSKERWVADSLFLTMDVHSHMNSCRLLQCLSFYSQLGHTT